DWQVFWFEGRNIMTLTLPRGKAVVLIQKNMEFADQGANAEVKEPLPKRQKFKHMTSNVSSDIAPMEDFFDN
ncbi:14425_t:CDS:1, partial [Entrophospora sp. SA101]